MVINLGELRSYPGYENAASGTKRITQSKAGIYVA